MKSKLYSVRKAIYAIKKKGEQGKEDWECCGGEGCSENCVIK